MRKSYKLGKGFTLIEMVIYIGTLAIFLAILTQIFTSILDIRTKTEATSSLEQDSRYILSRLFYDIQRAQVITTPGGLGVQGPRLDITIDGSLYSYYIDGNNNLVVEDNTGVNTMNSIGTTISGLIFRRLGTSITGKNTIQVTLTITSVAIPSTQVETKVIQTTIGTR